MVSSVSEWQRVEGGFRTRLIRHERLFGTFAIELGGLATADAYAEAALNFVIVDLEHSAFGLQGVAALVRAIQGVRLAAIVRVPAGTREWLTRAADMGPDGLMVPGVESVEEVQEIVEAARYWPAGSRGMCPLLRLHRLDADRLQEINRQLALLVQIEGTQGLAAAEGIARVSGVDALFVGTFDLSQALGVPGEIDSPCVLSAIAGIRDALPETVALGAYVNNSPMVAALSQIGATVLAYGTDGQLFLDGARRAAALLRGGVPPGSASGDHRGGVC